MLDLRTALGSFHFARVIHQNLTHNASGKNEEVAAILERDLLQREQSKKYFVHQFGSLPVLILLVVPEVGDGHVSKMVVYQRGQSSNSCLIALPPQLELVWVTSPTDIVFDFKATSLPDTFQTPIPHFASEGSFPA